MTVHRNGKGNAMLPAGIAVANEEHDRINTTMPRNTGWQDRHMREWGCVGQSASASTHGRAIATMIRAWLEYADAHRARFEDGIGQDYVLGPEWAAIGKALKGLLDGEIGQLDGGTLSTIILSSLIGEGFEDSE